MLAILNTFKPPYRQVVCLHPLILTRALLNSANLLLHQDIYRVLEMKVLLFQLRIIRLRKAGALEPAFMMEWEKSRRGGRALSRGNPTSVQWGEARQL